MEKTVQKQRFSGLDIIRGSMVMLMILYHGMYLFVDVFHGIDFSFHGTILQVLTGIGGAIFIFIAGVSAALTYEKIQKKSQSFFLYCLKRFFILSMLASITTLGTYFFEPQQLILFGILHFFAVGFLLLPIFSRQYWLNFFLALILILSGIGLIFFTFDIEYLWIFGIRSSGFFSADYYPILPYFGVLLLGFFIGKKQNQVQKIFAWDFPKSAFVRWFGKNSLVIYLVHIPILYGIFWLIFRI